MAASRDNRGAMNATRRSFADVDYEEALRRARSIVPLLAAESAAGEAATRVSADLKRDRLGLAVQELGDFPVGVEDKAVFGPGKLTGGDTVQFIVFRKSCKCWQPASGFRPTY